MQPSAILVPLCAQALLTVLVWFYMYYERISELQRKRVVTQDLADADYAEQAMKESVNSSDNFENLFEVPVLFYVGVLTIHVTNQVDDLFVVLAWAFVMTRAMHSVIHCTYNCIMHRFVTYAISTLVLWAIWIRITLHVIG